MKKNIIILVSIIALAILLRVGYSQFIQFMMNKSMKNKPAPSVVVEQVGQEQIIRTFEAPGRVVSKYRVDVLARISGYLLKSYFKEGDSVKKGQVLFLLEPTQYKNDTNVAAANVKNLEAQLEYAEKQLLRASELVKKDYIAKSQYDELLANRDSTKAQLTSAMASYNDSQRNLGYTQIKSPIDGQVGIISTTVGNYVTPTAGALSTINSTDPMYVTFPLDSNDFALINSSDKTKTINRKVELTINNGDLYEITGVQDFQDNKIEESTGTITMRATFENPNNKLIHGEFVTVKLYANETASVPIVPVTAVLENQAGKYVYKLDENNLPNIQYVKTDGQSGDFWIISTGLEIGDKIITEGLQKVLPGKPIQEISKEEMAETIEEETKNSK
ncbi:MAG: efflux RND transporter periplasmic adaptor subunit [Candidatus Gastranaerophilales bacterium]